MMSAHVSSVCRVSILLPAPATSSRAIGVGWCGQVVHAFISSRLDYCNSLQYGISDILLRRLQAVQNAAARLVTGTRRCDHIIISPHILQQLHWLPAWQPVEFKLAVLVHKALNNLAPPYLSEIACSLPPLGAVSFDHQTISSALSFVPVHVLEIEHSLLSDHVFGTVFLHMSVNLICPWTPSAANWKRT